MSKNWKYERRKYVDIDVTPEGLKYYGIVDEQRIEVSKEVYLVLEHSYHKDFNMDCERSDEDHISLDQLLEKIDDYDKHGAVPATFQSPSAEQEFLDNDPVGENSIPDKIMPEFSQLNKYEKQLLLTYGKKDSFVNQAAIDGNVSKRTIQRYRKAAADKIKSAYDRRVKHNE